MTSEELPENDLLKACINGDKYAWDLFVERYTNLVYHTIQKTLKICSTDFLYQDIEDLHNNIFLSLIEENYKKLRQYKGINKCSVSSWIMVIATNATINFITRRKQHFSLEDSRDDNKSLSDILPAPDKSVIDQIDESERYTLLEELLKELSVNDKLFLQYYYVDEISPEEIAGILNVTVSAIYSKKSRIIEKLREIAKKKKILQGM
jgi:RNA polymerase sigma-70 factor (ECF subfamily)